MKLSEISTSKYLTAADVPPAGITYVIEYAYAEEMPEPAWDGGKQFKPAVKLRNVRKVFLFNKTNRDVIEAAYGDDMDAWVGKPLHFRVDPTQYKGKATKGVRISCESFDDDVEDVPALSKKAAKA
jgi:hypothetical protein